MKKTILIISLLTMALLVNSCSINSSVLNPINSPISTKIKSLKFGLEGDNVYKTTHSTTETWQSYNATLFKRTIDENVLDNNGDGEWGYIDLTYTFNLFKFRGYNFTSWFGPFIGTSIFGNPIDFTREVQYEISIYDSNRKLIKTYVFDDKKVIWFNMYNAQVAAIKSQMEQINRILRSFENAVSADADYINSRLEKAGKIKS